ncbi:PREDICTED: uncharacterized protein LOC109487142 [Branchiostoma belcheri]|uniref:Uncharacterized protein LOC109487142 n=1 Tax=Branchiostoma belcheri TaxID=7741 RepID=A0A6P5AAP6_BRABE|nr:PREDICTED: uncharacterized protein LOC109487142 [Branchiostoma belcheri]
MATRWLSVFLVMLTLVELGTSDPMFTFIQDRLSKKEQDAIFDLFKKHWKPGVPDDKFEEYLTRVVYSPSILKENLPHRIVELLRALDNVERLELVREVREAMEFRDAQKEDANIFQRSLLEEQEKVKNEQKLVAALKAKKKAKKANAG